MASARMILDFHLFHPLVVHLGPPTSILSTEAQNFLREEHEQNPDFATCAFHTLLPSAHAEGPATFVNVRKQLVIVYRNMKHFISYKIYS